MKKYIKIFLAVVLFTFSIDVNAATKTSYVNLENLEYSNNGKEYKKIEEYKTLEGFLEDYNSNKLPNIYITDFLFDGVSSVKVRDLDDYIENDTNEIEEKTLDIKVINLNTTGNIELTGSIKGAMIGVDANNVIGNINIVLNNASINTDTKKAPAIYVYHKDKNSTDCKVTIKTVSKTKNYIEGGKLKKVSLVPSDELDKYTNYYSGDNLTNYHKYSAYYGVYTNKEIKNILFATVQADTEDLQDGDPYYFYKASGAISSDIDLYFEGDGYLNVTSTNEGIETKGNLTFSGATGDYEIYAEDDCLNTTTANSNNSEVRNDLTINVNSLLASVSEEADEGDAIDSNGKLIIEGGTIFAFAHPNSGDAGLDSTNGTFINGGTVIATGNMVDPISNESKQKYIFTSFNQIKKETLIVLKNQKDKVITAFKTQRNIQNLLYSTKNLNYKSYKVYTGGTIDGEEKNGLYTKINSYSGGEEITYNDVSNTISQKKDISNTVLIILIVEIILLVITLTMYLKTNNNETNTI